MASFAHADESRDGEAPPPGMVHVEQSDLIPPKPPKRDYELKPYSERRGKWGALLGFAYSSYTPSNYVPNFATTDFGSVYGTPQTPLLEGQLTIKRNFSFGSAGIEIGFGYYDNVGSGTINSELQLTQGRLGAIVILDTLFSTPYLAPYGSVGAYMMQISESMNNNSFNGNTSVAPYITVGVQATLDWIDRDSARSAYMNGDIQSTFLFAELRTYFASANKTDPDFSASIAPGGGLRVEF